MAVSLAEDFSDAESLKRELEEGFLPMLEEHDEISAEDAQALCAKVVEVERPRFLESSGRLLPQALRAPKR